MTSSRVDRPTARARVGRHAVAFGARLGVLLAAAGGVLLEPFPSWGLVVAALFAAATSAARPDRLGAAPPLVVLLAVWLVDYGSNAAVPLPRTIGFAVLLLVIHECAALASAVPAWSYATAAVVRHWLVHLAPEAVAVLAAAGLVAVTGRIGGSLAVDIAGLAAVIVVVAALSWLANRTTHRNS